MHVKVAGLFVAATTRKNVSPSLVLELLHRVAKVIKDYCGVLSEDALRKNSILAYELICGGTPFADPDQSKIFMKIVQKNSIAHEF